MPPRKIGTGGFKRDPSTPSPSPGTTPRPDDEVARQKNADLYQKATEAQGQVGQAPSAPGSTNNPYIFMGPGHEVQRQSPGTATSGPTFGMVYTEQMTIQEALDLFWRFTDSQANSFNNFIAGSGGDLSKMTTKKKFDIWKQYVETAFSYQQNGKNYSPWAVMFMELAEKGRLKEEELSKAKTTTATQTTVDLSSPEDAEAILFQASQTLLGRAPTADEIGRFSASINQYERANPSFVTTTSTTDEEGRIVSQDVERTGGTTDAARSLMAQQEAQANPEYGAHQAATTYYDAMMQMLRGG